MSVIPTFGRLRQEDCFEIKASQGYIAKACFKIDNRKRNQTELEIQSSIPDLHL